MMGAFLLFQAFPQRFHQFFPSAQGLDLPLFLFTEVQFRLLSQPFHGDFGNQVFHQVFHAFKVGAEDPVKSIKIFFILDEGGAHQVIKPVDVYSAHSLVQGIHQGQVFGNRNRDTAFPKFVEQIYKHELSVK